MAASPVPRLPRLIERGDTHLLFRLWLQRIMATEQRLQRVSSSLLATYPSEHLLTNLLSTCKYAEYCAGNIGYPWKRCRRPRQLKRRVDGRRRGGVTLALCTRWGGVREVIQITKPVPSRRSPGRKIARGGQGRTNESSSSLCSQREHGGRSN